MECVRGGAPTDDKWERKRKKCHREIPILMGEKRNGPKAKNY